MQRTEAREFVLSALYQIEFVPASLEEMLEETDPGDQREYIEHVFNGIVERRDALDEMLAERTVGWKFQRLAAIDRNILRIGLYELLYFDEIPAEVAMDEAVELAKRFGTEHAQSFVNGILDAIWKEYGERDPS